MSNRLVLSKTTNYQNSKMDFYQYYESGDGAYAMTSTHRKNSSGVYYAMPIREKDIYDWVYAEIRINDARMVSLSSSKKEAVIIHEMLHVYELKDLYNLSNRGSIMYGRSDGTATGVTSDANQVLNSKY